MTETPPPTIATATITTAEPARIILRLCKHWGHKFTVSYDDAQGRIEFPEAQCLMSAGDGQLTFRIEVQPQADIAQLEQVVADHAQRMARGETYVWNWQRAAA
jgi:hypothetical protein